MNGVNIKKELETLDRNDFDQVNDLVIRIISDIMDFENLINENDADPFYSLIQDYMIDLINPELLDFDSRDC
jgi:hypothetical protein